MNARIHDILEQVQRGELTPSEGAVLMEQLTSQVQPPVQPPEPASPVVDAAKIHAEEADRLKQEQLELDASIETWKRWWQQPLWIGMSIFVISAAGIAWAHLNERIFWFYCWMLPLVLGLLGVILAWWSQSARWLHVRVKDCKNGRTNQVNLSMPLPVRLAGWGLRVFGRFIPGIQDPQVAGAVSDMLQLLGDDREPLSVEVDEEDSKVRVYII